MFKRLLSVIDFRYLGLIVLTYGLGVSISHYLGNPIDWSSFWNGILWIIGILVSSFYLREYFKKQHEKVYRKGILLEKDGFDPRQETNMLKVNLLIGITWLAVSIIPLMNLLIVKKDIAITMMFMFLHMGLTYLVVFFPGILSRTGLMEFVNALIVANLVPAIGFTLQSDGMHHLLLTLTFPLMFLYFVLFIIFTLQDCERSEDAYRCSIVRSMGTMKIVDLHNLLIIFGYLSMILGVLFYVPWKLIWPPLITLPLGAIQIWQINQLRKDGNLAISPLVLNAIATAGFSTYFLLLTLWL